MSEIQHNIQKQIIRVLMGKKVSRYSDMRPRNANSNLYNYHLKKLLSGGYVLKNGREYRLAPKGLRYVDRLSLETFESRRQPKLVTSAILLDEMGRVLMYKQPKQPFIDGYTIPIGKIHEEDASISAAMSRELKEKLGVDITPIYTGQYYMRVLQEGEHITTILNHVFRARVSADIEVQKGEWVEVGLLKDSDMYPGIKEILGSSMNNEQFTIQDLTIDYDPS